MTMTLAQKRKTTEQAGRTLYTVKEVAQILRKNPQAIYATCEKALIGHHRLAGSGEIRISAEDLDAYLMTNYTPATLGVAA